ncbi:MAG: hypothetical protein Q8R55_03090 [Candidatus Taylorbacteria bacterium]|nr:hypothetical protein [Candidatus Taylorbacteria bacterium]
MKTKFYYLVLLAGVALMVMFFVRKHQDSSSVFNTGGEDIQKQEMSAGEKIDSGKNYLEGILYNSEDPNRGNLKLISKLGDIYLKTARDFSSLVGFQVLVLINGTHENFELLDIQMRIADEGFIQAR